MTTINFEERLRAYSGEFAPVVPFAKGDRLLLMDFTSANEELTDDVVNDTNRFIEYINRKLRAVGAKYGIGGYGEDRSIYRRSSVFDAPLRGLSDRLPHPDALQRERATGAQTSLVEEASKKAESLKSGERSAGGLPPSEEGREGGLTVVGMGHRSIHLGTDIWGAPYTKVMAPLNGIVHSFAFNNAYGDYGATMILTHNLEGQTFHTLYGHVSLNSIKNLQEGQNVFKGDVIAEFGIPFENGQWPPHLHFQIIRDMQGMKGDYPGVCAVDERETYLSNCPDADLILGMMRYAE